MRILHVFDHSLPLQSGYVTRSLGIIRAQRARGWDTIHLTTPRQGSSAGREETIDGLTFHRTRGARPIMPVVNELREMRATRRELESLVQKSRPDIIHAHSPVLNAIPALGAGRRLGIPVVYEARAFWEDAAVDHGTTREHSVRYRVSRWLDTRTMRRAGHVVAICEPMRQEMVGRGLDATRVSVVPNAVDPFYLARAETLVRVRAKYGLGEQPVIGFIGSFYAYEGLDLLLSSLSALFRLVPGVRILLVGGGPDEERLRGLARGFDDRVIFAGRVPQAEVPSWYAAIDLLVYPRRRMRLTELVTPLKPLEAMAQGKPVLASDVGGHRELIADGHTGFFFPADDAEALARRIAKLLDDRQALARVAESGWRFVEAERNWNTVSGRYADIYGNLLASPDFALRRRSIA